MKLLVATHNSKKLRELQRILEEAGLSEVELLTLRQVPSYPEPVENGATFAENALIKARAGVHATGLPTLADDSGLSVAALNGMPGVLSARWSGVEGEGKDVANYRLLLAQLAAVEDERRAAAFCSVCALVTPDGREHLTEGTWEGRIATEPRGEGGFGYDPVFEPADTQGRSAAQLSAQEKDQRSHRGAALAAMVPIISELISQV